MELPPQARDLKKTAMHTALEVKAMSESEQSKVTCRFRDKAEFGQKCGGVDKTHTLWCPGGDAAAYAPYLSRNVQKEETGKL